MYEKSDVAASDSFWQLQRTFKRHLTRFSDASSKKTKIYILIFWKGKKIIWSINPGRRKKCKYAIERYFDCIHYQLIKCLFILIFIKLSLEKLSLFPKCAIVFLSVLKNKICSKLAHKSLKRLKICWNFFCPLVLSIVVLRLCAK